MPRITRLANSLREANPLNLFCLVEFGDHGIIYATASGNGTWSDKEIAALKNEKDVRWDTCGRKSGKDSEEYFCEYLPGIWKEVGCPSHLTIITAASPCDRVCSKSLRKVAETCGVTTVTIAYMSPYRKDQKQNTFENALQTMNSTIVSGTQIKAFQLHESFIDGN